MSSKEDLTAMADACLAANSAIATHGTPEMQSLMRVLLRLVGLQLVGQGVASVDGNDDDEER